MKIVVKNAVKRKPGWLYFIDVDGNLRGYDMRKRMKHKIKQKKKELCVICNARLKRSETAKTCCQSCAGKLAWETRLSALG